MTIRNIDDLATAFHNHGNHWFDKETLHWFRCRISEASFTIGPDGAYYFVSSEQQQSYEHGPYPRLYTVRRATVQPDSVDVDSICGGFQAWDSRDQAISAMRAHINELSKVL